MTMELLQEIEAYEPFNEQERRDKEQILSLLRREQDIFFRTNLTAHITVSVWVINPSHTKTLMVYHNLYDSWSWIGGHADGEKELKKVALKELKEETGVQKVKFITEEIFSLEILTVAGHEKKGQYVPSHLHLNITYLAEAAEEEELKVCKEENKEVKWWPLKEALGASTEPWMVQRIYKKLIEKNEKCSSNCTGGKDDRRK